MERVEPRAERPDPVGLVSPPEQHAEAQAARVHGELVQDSGLADSRVPEDGHERSLPALGSLERRPQLSELPVAADERGPARGAVGPGREVAVRHDGRSFASSSGMPQDVPVEPASPCLGLEPELLLQDVHAGLVLSERRTTAPEARVEPHQRPVHGLLNRIQGEEAKGGLDGGLEFVPRPTMGQKPRQRLQGKLAQPLPLGQEPLLEGLGLDAKDARGTAAAACGTRTPSRRRRCRGRSA